MAKRVFLAALFLAGLLIINHYPAERLVEPVLTIYLIIAGFLMILMRGRAWEFLKPLFLIGFLLLILPPLFHDLVRAFKVNLHLSLNMGWDWLWPLLAAAIVFTLFRLFFWLKDRPRRKERKVLRERDRVAPPFEFDDEERL